MVRNGEKCGKFTFFFRKKFYLSRKYAVPKFATSCSRETLCVALTKNIKNYNKNMKKNLIPFLMIFMLISCNKKPENKLDIISSDKKPKTEIGASIALKFINDYTEISNEIMLTDNKISIDDWIEKYPSLTDNFKSTYKDLVKNAEKEDPELGLDSDPIFDAQDYPEKGFEISKIDNKNGYITFKGRDWSSFLVNIKMKLINKKWLVDGAGTINISQNKRTNTE